MSAYLLADRIAACSTIGSWHTTELLFLFVIVIIFIIVIIDQLTHEKPMQPMPSERMSAQMAGYELAVA